MFVQYLWVLVVALFVVAPISAVSLSLSRRVQRWTGPVLTAAVLLFGVSGFYLWFKMFSAAFRSALASLEGDALDRWFDGCLASGTIIFVSYLMLLPLVISLFGSTAASCGSIINGQWRTGSFHQRLLHWSLGFCFSDTISDRNLSPHRSICAESLCAHWIVTGPALALLALCAIGFLAGFVWFFLSVCLPIVIVHWRDAVPLLSVAAAIFVVPCGLIFLIEWLPTLPRVRAVLRVICPPVADDD